MQLSWSRSELYFSCANSAGKTPVLSTTDWEVGVTRFGSCLCKSATSYKQWRIEMSKISLPFSAFLFSLFFPFVLHHLKHPSLHISSFSGPCHPSTAAPWLSGKGETALRSSPRQEGAWLLQSHAVQFSLSSPSLLQPAKTIHFSCPKYIFCADISPSVPVQYTSS